MPGLSSLRVTTEFLEIAAGQGKKKKCVPQKELGAIGNECIFLNLEGHFSLFSRRGRQLFHLEGMIPWV